MKRTKTNQPQPQQLTNAEFDKLTRRLEMVKEIRDLVQKYDEPLKITFINK